MSTVFETIKDRLPITDVLSAYITLTPSGSQWKAKCPFHSEKTPSFSVSPDRGLYYCFGCGAKGDIFTFVEQFEGLDKRGALKVLADRAGVILTKDNTKRESADPVYELLEKAKNFYQTILDKNSEGLKYLKDRGLNDETIKEFGIGYVSDEWRTIADRLKNRQESSIGERAGLVKKTEDGRYYDTFRKRIMFPLSDASGRVVGFSGRLFPEGNDDGPKYLNSPETEVFQKSKILFGFDKAKGHIRKHNFAILVEGQFDLVLSHQAGFRNTIATSGTAVSDISASDPTTNLSAISRITPNILLAFDGDSAGQKALDKAALVALKLGMNPKVVPLPKGLDPADYLKEQGAQPWKELLKDSKHFLLHEVDRINEGKHSPHALVTVIKNRLFPFLSAIISPIEQNLYLESISKELSLPKSKLVDEFSIFIKSLPQTSLTQETVSPKGEDSVTSLERLLAIVKKYPNEKRQDTLHELTNLKFKEQSFKIEGVSEERMHILVSIIEDEYGLLSDAEKDSLVLELSNKVRDNFFAILIGQYTKELNLAEAKGDEEKTQELLVTLQEVNRLRQPNG